MADAPNANDELYPIAVLIDELKVNPYLTMHTSLPYSPFLPTSAILSSLPGLLAPASMPIPLVYRLRI